MQEHDNESSFDWADLPAAPDDPHHGVHRYVDHLLSTGMTEEAVFDYLVEAGLDSSLAALMIAEVQRNRRQGLGPGPAVRSGPYDFGEIFDNLRRQDLERRDRRKERRELRKQSARLAATDPDAAFALDGQPGYSQVVAQRANERWKISGFRLLVVVTAVGAILLIVALALLRAFW